MIRDGVTLDFAFINYYKIEIVDIEQIYFNRQRKNTFTIIFVDQLHKRILCEFNFAILIKIIVFRVHWLKLLDES